MAIPKFEQLFNVTLQALRQLGGSGHISAIDNKVADLLALSDEEQKQIHEGSRTELSYRLAWARNYLKRYGLMEKIGRGLWSLTAEGMTVEKVTNEEVLAKVKVEQVNEAVAEEGDETIATEIDNPFVEAEDNTNSEASKELFDPKKIDIVPRQLILDLFIKRIRRNAIDFSTGFQRQSDLWDKTKQSRLIESLLLRFPLPSFYFDGTDDNNWQVVDGLQRLSTFRNFIVNKTLRLENLEFLTQYDGLGFDDLPEDLQRRIEECEVTAYIIKEGTPPNVKYNIFKRINTGGLVLEPQEIRHAINQGAPARFVKELADLDEFKEATCYSIKQHRMQDRDFTTRFISFYLIPYSQYQPDLDTFMNKGMAAINNLGSKGEIKVKSDFINSMNACIQIFRNDAFRKRYNLYDNRKPINKALFEVWSVTFARLKEQELRKLVQNRTEVINKFIELMNTDARFVASIASATGDTTQVYTRFSTIEALIKQIIGQ